MPQEQTPGNSRLWRWGLIVAAVCVGLFFANRALLGWSHDQVAWRSSFNQASVEAGDSDKPLLVYFTADWCGPCKQMKAWVYSDKAVADAIDAGFVPVKVDLSTEGLPDQAVAERYEIQSIPTLLALTADGTPIKRSVGYVNKEDFLTWLKSASMRYVKLGEDDQAHSDAIVEAKNSLID